MQLRSSYKPFLNAVDRYFGKLLPMLAQLQVGPVVIFFSLEFILEAWITI